MRLLGTQAEPESETAGRPTELRFGSTTPKSRANTTAVLALGLGGLRVDFEARLDGTYGVT